MENSNSNLLDKLHELNTLAKRRDFNPDILNKYFVKSITSLYTALYGGKTNSLEKYLSEDYLSFVLEANEKDKLIYRFENVLIKIEKMDMIDQSVEGVSFVSSLTLRVRITLFYIREYIPGGMVREFKEVIEESIYYKNEDTGWKIKKKFARDMIESVDRLVLLK